MANNSSDTIRKHFQLADQFLATARKVEQEGDLRTAADRAYYAMFHAASAALAAKGISTKTHTGLLNKLGSEYIKTGLLDRKFSGYMRMSFDLRQAGDYAIHADIDQTKVDEVVDWADEFVAKLKEILGIK